MAQARAIAARRASRRCRATSWSPTLSHGQQRQLEIALALAGAPRFILFDEPAAGLSPAERRDLVTILNALPTHIGYIIIEHDLDVALRVVERVTMMHNGRLLQGGHAGRRSRTTPRCRRSISEAAMAEPARSRPSRPSRDRRPPRLLRRGARLQGVSLTLDRGVLAVVGRNGMGKTTLCNTDHRPEARALAAAIRSAAARSLGLEPHVITGAASATCRRGGASGRACRSTSICAWSPRGGADATWTVERVYQTFPRLAERRSNGGAQLSGGEQQMLAIGARAARQSAAAGHGRADRRAGADHRRPGRGDAGRSSPKTARSPCC